MNFKSSTYFDAFKRPTRPLKNKRRGLHHPFMTHMNSSKYPITELSTGIHLTITYDGNIIDVEKIKN